MELLVFLAEHAGEVVSRRQILDEVWPQEFVADATLSGAIAKLRRAFGDDAHSPRFIETLSKRGYRMLTRPIEVLEVASRPGGAFRIGDWLVEPGRNRMSRTGATVELERSTMDILLVLAERAGETVPQGELVDRVWRTESVSDFTVSRRIAELQEAFGDRGANPGYIENVPEGGYRLAAAVGFTEPRATVMPFPDSQVHAQRDPYPGLAAFTAADAEVFFGREAETAAMWRRISGRRLLAVIGPSGVGKSSFVRAGVIAAAPPGWRTLICTPGEAPFIALARALVPELAGDAGQVEKLLDFDDTEVALGVFTHWQQRSDGALLVVDQLEELFTLNPPEIRKRFVDLLVRLAAVARVHVVLVLRDDFLHECHAHPPLEPIFRDLTLLGPPAAGDLRRALVEPARRRDFHFDDDELADEMVASVATERGALPLLAFAARRLWELRDRERRLITRESYESIGGVAGALAQHAEATLEAIGAERLPLVRELFRNLVTAQQTRATRSVDDLLSVFDEGRREDAAMVLQALVDARLLTSFEEEATGEGEGPRRIEIVHESLLREWPRLVGWQTQDADAARLRDQLRQAAQLWQARGRPAELLWSGTPYREFRLWRESYPGGLSGAEQAFADAMVIQAGRRRRRRRLVTAAVLLVTMAGLVVTTTLWRRSETSARRMEARRLAEIARETMARFPPVAFAYAVASIEIMDDPEARRLAFEALWRSPMPLVIGRGQLPASAIGVDFSPNGQWLSVGHFDGYVALWPESGGEPIVWQPHEGRPRGYFTPDSRAVLSMSTAEPRYVLWSVPDLRPLGTFDKVGPDRPDTDARSSNVLCDLIRLTPDPSSAVGWRCDLRPLELINEITGERIPAAALSPDGSEMTIASGEELFGYAFGRPRSAPLRLGRSPSKIEYVAYNPGGDRLATAHTDGAVRLWDLHGRAASQLREWPNPRKGGCNQVVFEPSGAAVAAVLDDGATILWSLDDVPGSEPLVLSVSGSRGIELSFHPDGRWLAAANMSVVSLWPIELGRHPLVLRGHSGQVEDLAFAPDGSWLASIANDGTVRRWPMAAEAGDPPRVLHDWGHRVERMIGSLAMSPDGEFVVTTAGEDVARMAPVDGSAPSTLGGFEQRVFRVAIGQQGRLVAVPGRSGDRLVVRVWDREAGSVTDVGVGHGGSSLFDWWADLAFRRDGRVLVAFKGRLLLLDPATGEKATLAEGEIFEITSARGGDVVLSRPDVDRLGVTTIRDLEAGTEIRLESHGSRVTSIALDREGTIAVTGSRDGIVRVGPATGGEPHWLVGPRGDIESVAVSPDGRWIASGHADGAIRLWPMPDLTRPPLHDLPRPELLARLRSLTNLRVVRDPDDPESFVVRAEPFPGWHTVPEW